VLILRAVYLPIASKEVVDEVTPKIDYDFLSYEKLTTKDVLFGVIDHRHMLAETLDMKTGTLEMRDCENVNIFFLFFLYLFFLFFLFFFFSSLIH
jgi:hypothetical protein